MFVEDLPKSIIHGDWNDENALVAEGRVVALLDFGDCLYNPTICELAIAVTYAIMDEADPLGAGAEIVAGFHQIRPLLADELEVLFPLICGRLAASVSTAAERRQIDPDRSAWFAHEERAWRTIERLLTISPVEASRRLASETGVAVFSHLGRSSQDLLEQRRQRFASSLSISYDEPLKIVRGRGQFLYDESGWPYLDLYNNVCHVGHCHPRVVTAGARQMEILNTNTRYLYDGLTEYAERLCATLPDQLQFCFLVNSGSEANELAIRLAREHTGNDDLLVVEGAYHGHTTTMIDISPYKFLGKGGSGESQDWVHVVPVADGYRGRHKGQDRSSGVAYGDEVGATLELLERPVAGFICESLLSCGGQVIPPAGYLETAYKHVRRAAGVCIADEVQVGFGRVGSHFWAFELQDVVPDIVVMGKPIGNGHPMSAVVTTVDIAESFARTGMEFFSTFGGNPVSCAIGMAVLDVIRDEGLQENAARVGSRLRDGLRDLMNKHPLIGDVRGVGLFVGVELVRDRSTLEPAPQEAEWVVNELRRRQILAGTEGIFGNVIKIKPPMVITEADADWVVDTVDQVLSTSAPG
jgi:4-aminobutyrate aminotransferase-like enzyme